MRAESESIKNYQCRPAKGAAAQAGGTDIETLLGANRLVITMAAPCAVR